MKGNAAQSFRWYFCLFCRSTQNCWVNSVQSGRLAFSFLFVYFTSLIPFHCLPFPHEIIEIIGPLKMETKRRRVNTPKCMTIDSEVRRLNEPQSSNGLFRLTDGPTNHYSYRHSELDQKLDSRPWYICHSFRLSGTPEAPPALPWPLYR